MIINRRGDLLGSNQHRRRREGAGDQPDQGQDRKQTAGKSAFHKTRLPCRLKAGSIIAEILTKPRASNIEVNQCYRASSRAPLNLAYTF